MSLHIEANVGEIAEKVLLPGDPLRAKYIAETFLHDATCYNTIRGMYGYTGYYHGKRVSIQGTGMGIPSISIYTTELLNEYGVKSLIRVGTCGALNPSLNIRDIIMVLGASTDSSVNWNRIPDIYYAPTADFDLLNKAYICAKQNDDRAVVGNIYTADIFYGDKQKKELLSSYGVMAVDMETSELYTLAAKYAAKALTLLTVSDNNFTGERSTSEEREKSFNGMTKIALEIL